MTKPKKKLTKEEKITQSFVSLIEPQQGRGLEGGIFKDNFGILKKQDKSPEVFKKHLDKILGERKKELNWLADLHTKQETLLGKEIVRSYISQINYYGGQFKKYLPELILQASHRTRKNFRNMRKGYPLRKAYATINLRRGLITGFTNDLCDLMISFPTEKETQTVHNEEKFEIPIEKPNLNERKKTARKILQFFSGNNLFNEKIMPDKDFERLMQYTDYLIEFEKAPKTPNPISRIKLGNQWIIYEYQRIHRKLYGRKRRRYFYGFLQTVFMQLSDYTSIHAKFTDKPSASYKEDIKKLQGYFGDN